ncbi:MAG: VOC family protein, partial [Chloroflexi bacterium]|nr:VOC family protein [Chloroflexota bacterium]
DIEAKAQLVEEAGGYIVEAPFEIQSGTKICLFNEPSGVTFAMLQSAANM